MPSGLTPRTGRGEGDKNTKKNSKNNFFLKTRFFMFRTRKSQIEKKNFASRTDTQEGRGEGDKNTKKNSKNYFFLKTGFLMFRTRKSQKKKKNVLPPGVG